MIPVAANGIYDIPIDVYHSQGCCNGASASSTTLRTILHQCPAIFYAYSDLNPKPAKRKETKALNFGSAAHALMLGEPAFDARFIVSPFENFNTSQGRAWSDAWKTKVKNGEPRIVIRPSEFEIIEEMVAAQRANPDCARAFTEGAPERSLIWKDKETSIWLKSRPDWLPHDPAKRLTTEYKTTETAKPERLSAAVFKYGYEMQAALVLEGIENVLQVTPAGFAHVVQEKEAPWLAELKLFTPEQIDFGFRQNRKAIRMFADCVEHDTWPGWSIGPSYYETPYYIAKAMAEFNDDFTHPAAG